MKRRSFLISAVASTGAIVAGAGAWLSSPASDAPLTLDAMVELLHSFRGKSLVTTGQWSAAHIFNHNAQSIDYSMIGFPQSKGPVFQALVGSPAFAVFRAKRAMRHGLTEPIPGGYDIPDSGSTDAAIDKLLASIASFKAYSGALKPHFAYGDLSKADYELAHVMHFANHMSEIHV